MKILTAEQIRNVDALTIAMEPIKSVDLLERAGSACFKWIDDFIEKRDLVQVYCGPGNNGGDGLALARMLLYAGYIVEIYMLTKPENCSNDSQINFQLLKDYPGFTSIYFLEDSTKVTPSYDNSLIIDALFGTGLSRPLQGLAKEIILHINQSKAYIVSIDIPSGLISEGYQNTGTLSIVKADVTLTFQIPKLSFMFSENEKYVGKWHCLDIQLLQKAIDNQKTAYNLIQLPDIKKKLKKRVNFSHKGNFGHALLIAGSYGRMGAAILAARACLRSGAGLLTAHIVQKGYDIMQTSVPEAMVTVDYSLNFLTTLPFLNTYNSIGIGPGIGTNESTITMFFQLLKSNVSPMVIDADGINILSLNPGWMALLQPNTILTPHPGEFDRLTTKHESGWHRHLTQIQLSKKYNIIIVLKGAYTSITDGEGNCWFNSTGNPGMSTAGSGDVLTGITLSLLAQGYSAIDAALSSVYLHGLAGDIIKNEIGEEALIASDIINNLGKAFKLITKQN